MLFHKEPQRDRKGRRRYNKTEHRVNHSHGTVPKPTFPSLHPFRAQCLHTFTHTLHPMQTLLLLSPQPFTFTDTHNLGQSLVTSTSPHPYRPPSTINFTIYTPPYHCSHIHACYNILFLYPSPLPRCFHHSSLSLLCYILHKVILKGI